MITTELTTTITATAHAGMVRETIVIVGTMLFWLLLEMFWEVKYKPFKVCGCGHVGTTLYR